MQILHAQDTTKYTVWGTKIKMGCGLMSLKDMRDITTRRAPANIDPKPLFMK